MSSSDRIILEMSDLVGTDTVVRPAAASLVRHLSDYGLPGQSDPGVLALTYPRDTAQVSRILRYCNERRIAVQPQGGMTGLSG